MNTIFDLPEPSISTPGYALLSQIAVIELSGEDREKYLQGQVTCDVVKTNAENWHFGAHCDAKGKVYSVFRMVKTDGHILLLTTKECAELSLAQLKKYAVFSKTELTLANKHLYFLSAEACKISELFAIDVVSDNKSVYIVNQGLLLSIDNDWLLIADSDCEQAFSNAGLSLLPAQCWDLREINAGIPFLPKAEADQYVPQMLNVQSINGISFNKGCYIGQETVARMQYLGKNKRALFVLSGHSNHAIKPSDVIEMSIGENWRRGGEVISVYQDEKGNCWLQSVMANDLDGDTQFRLKDDNASRLQICTLPYSSTSSK